MNLHVIIVISITMGLACSSQEINTGRNAHLQQPEILGPNAENPEKPSPAAEVERPIVSASEESEVESSEVDPVEEGETPSAPSTSTASEEEGSQTPSATESAPTTRFTCWGKASRVFPEIETVCKDVPADLAEEFATAIAIVCNEKKYLNLLHPKCGWDGDEANQSKYTRVIQMTPLADQGNDFYYLSVSAINFAKSPNTFSELTSLAYTKPDVFKKSFHLPDGPEIVPDGKGLVEIGEDMTELHYHFTVLGLTLTQFQARNVFWKLSDNVSAVFVAAVGEMKGIKKRAQLNIVHTGNDGIQRIVTFEERIVPDGKQHPIAYSKNRELDMSEMKNRFLNSQVQVSASQGGE